MSIKNKIKHWYLGGPLPAHERLSDTATALRAPNTFEPSASARFAQWVVKNILKILLIIVPAIVALFIYFDSKATNANTNHKETKNVSNAITHIPPQIKLKPLTKISIRPRKAQRLI